MLGYVALVFIVFLSFRALIQLHRQRSVLIEYGTSKAVIAGLQMSCLLYVLSLIGFAVPADALTLIRPIPVGFLMLVPGIVIGRRVASAMECAGIDTAERAGNTASNVMWLGIGTGLFIVANIVLGLIIASYGNQSPY